MVRVRVTVGIMVRVTVRVMARVMAMVMVRVTVMVMVMVTVRVRVTVTVTVMNVTSRMCNNPRNNPVVEQHVKLWLRHRHCELRNNIHPIQSTMEKIHQMVRRLRRLHKRIKWIIK